MEQEMNWLGLFYLMLCLWVPFGIIFAIAYIIGRRMQKKYEEEISNWIKQWDNEHEQKD